MRTVPIAVVVCGSRVARRLSMNTFIRVHAATPCSYRGFSAASFLRCSALSRIKLSASQPAHGLQLRRWLSTNSDVARALPKTSTLSPLPPTTWVDKLPPTVRPYLYLTRIDKPIGTLLLFYPCGSSFTIRCPKAKLTMSLLRSFPGL